MLRGISPLLSPDLLAILYRMGHGDDLVLVDAHYPADTCGKRVVRADGLGVVAMMNAILPLFELDTYVPDPVTMMTAVPGDSHDPALMAGMRGAIEREFPNAPSTAFIDRFAFYERSKDAYAILQTGETTKYGCVILKKGVTRV
jgi:L-fucose mutarotase